MPDSSAVRGEVIAGEPRPGLLSVGTTLRLRRLPGGDFRNGVAVGRGGRLLKINVQGEVFAIGTPLEIECGSMVYLGTLQHRDGPAHTILEEHALDRADLDFMQDRWD